MKISARAENNYGATAIGAWRATVFCVLMMFLWLAQFSYRAAPSEKVFSTGQIFFRLILKAMGFKIRVHGVMTHIKPTLFVSNHSSYLDVPILGAIIPASFVAKADVRQWPVIGMLCARQRTVFIERRAVRIADQSNHLRAHLEKGESLILFPEGTSSDGLSVLPFKSGFFSMVEKAEKPVQVQPVSIVCTGLDGIPMTRDLRPLYAWYGDMIFTPHLWKVFKRGHFTVDVVFHPPIDPKAFVDRKLLAAYCQQQVAHGIEQSLAGRGISTGDKPALPAPAGKLIGA